MECCRRASYNPTHWSRRRAERGYKGVAVHHLEHRCCRAASRSGVLIDHAVCRTTWPVDSWAVALNVEPLEVAPMSIDNEKRGTLREIRRFVRSLVWCGLRVGALFLCLVAGMRCGISQSTSASVSGAVRDQSGAVISGVQIVLTNGDTGVPHAAATGSPNDLIFPTEAGTPYRIGILSQAHAETDRGKRGDSGSHVPGTP